MDIYILRVKLEFKVLIPFASQAQARFLDHTRHNSPLSKYTSWSPQFQCLCTVVKRREVNIALSKHFGDLLPSSNERPHVIGCWPCLPCSQILIHSYSRLIQGAVFTCLLSFQDGLGILVPFSLSDFHFLWCHCVCSYR